MDQAGRMREEVVEQREGLGVTLANGEIEQKIPFSSCPSRSQHHPMMERGAGARTSGWLALNLHPYLCSTCLHRGGRQGRGGKGEGGEGATCEIKPRTHFLPRSRAAESHRW